MNRIKVECQVIVKAKDSWANGEWGIVKAIYGEDCFVAIANDPNQQWVFSKKELNRVKLFRILKGEVVK